MDALLIDSFGGGRLGYVHAQRSAKNTESNRGMEDGNRAFIYVREGRKNISSRAEKSFR
jgi:hypothetical protein